MPWDPLSIFYPQKWLEKAGDSFLCVDFDVKLFVLLFSPWRRTGAVFLKHGSRILNRAEQANRFLERTRHHGRRQSAFWSRIVHLHLEVANIGGNDGLRVIRCDFCRRPRLCCSQNYRYCPQKNSPAGIFKRYFKQLVQAVKDLTRPALHLGCHRHHELHTDLMSLIPLPKDNSRCGTFFRTCKDN